MDTVPVKKDKVEPLLYNRPLDNAKTFKFPPEQFKMPAEDNDYVVIALDEFKYGNRDVPVIV